MCLHLRIRDCNSSFSPRLRLPKDKDYWVAIPTGTFIMGNGKDVRSPASEVRLDAFLIGRFPVTVQQYGLYLEDTVHDVPEDWDDQSQHPNRSGG